MNHMTFVSSSLEKEPNMSLAVRCNDAGFWCPEVRVFLHDGECGDLLWSGEVGTSMGFSMTAWMDTDRGYCTPPDMSRHVIYCIMRSHQCPLP